MAIAGLLSAAPAEAAQSTVDFLLDLDDDATTGCTVATPDGPFDGVEQILSTTVETVGSSTANVTAVDRRECTDPDTDTFGPGTAVDPGDWPVGVGLGEDGFHVVETYFPLAATSLDPQVVRIGVVHTRDGAEDALLVAVPGTDTPILLELLSILEIPTLGQWGLILLALLLAAGSLHLLGRRGTVALVVVLVLGTAGLAWAQCVLDGMPGDWTASDLLGADPAASDDGIAVRAVFGRGEGGRICLRVDVSLLFNEPPDAVDDGFTVTEDSSGNALDVLGNDSDPETDPFTITGVGTPDQGGTVMITGGGTGLSYTPAPDFAGVETFTYTIEDSAGGSDTATVTVTVTNVNDPPDAVDDTATVQEDSSANPLDVLANDTDAPDAGETLTITGVGTPDQGGSVTITGGGTGLEYTPAADFAGVETFTYTIDDGNTGMDTATVTVTVTNVNDPPDAIDDMPTVDEDSSANSLDVLANDTAAPDTGETLTITGVGTPDQGGTATTDGSTITYTPAANFVGVETFTYTIGDGNGGSDTATVSVTVQDANPDPPVCGADSATTDEDSSTLVDVLNDDTDPDPGQTATLTVSAVDTTGTTGMVTNNGTDVTYDPNGQFESLDDGEMAMDTFSYTAQDSTGLTCMATVTVTITGVNDAPTVLGEVFDVAAGNFEPAIGNTTLQFANSDTVTTPHRFVSGDVLDNDSDPENDGLALTGFQNPSTQGGTVSMNLATGELTYLPPVGFEGVDTFTYTVSDGTGSSTGTVTVEVADMVWYIDNDPANDGSGDDGRSASGFDSIAQFEAENGVGAADDPEAGDVIYVFQGTSTYDAGGGDLDGLDLLDQQKLLGEGVDLVLQGLTLVAGNPANRPSIDNTNSNGDAVTVLADAADRTGVEIRGLSIDGADNAVEVTSANTFQVEVTISDNTIAGSGGEGIHLNPGSSGAFVTTLLNNEFSTASPAGNAIDLTTAAASGDVEIALDGNTDVTSSGGSGIVLDNSAGGGNLFVTGFANNTVHGNTTGDGIRILNATFDADPSDVDFTGDEIAAGNTSVGSGANPVGGSALVLTNVAGDLAFGTLDLFTEGMGAVGLAATGNGLLNAGAGTGFEVTNTGGTIDSANGPAVNLDPLTAGLAFGSVSSGNSAVHGIRLHDVAGSFSATGGTLADSVGSAIRVTGTNPGDSTVVVSLSGMTINHTTGLTPVIFGQNSSGLFSLTGSTLSKGGGRVLEFDDMDGGSDFTGTTVTSTNHHGKRIIDSQGTHNLPAIQIATAPPVGVDALHLANNVGATINVPSLNVTTNGSRGLFASNGGTLNVTGATNQITTTGHSAVEMSNTTIGGSGVTFASLSATSTGSNEGVDLDGVGGGTFNVTGTTTVNGTGAGQSALDVATSGATFTFSSIDVDNPGGAGVALTNNTGIVTLTGGDISGAAGNAFDVDQGAANVTYGGTVNNGAARAVEVTNRTGGAVTFGGAIVDSGASNSGVFLNNNDAGTVAFNGTVDVTGTSGAGVSFQNSNGGTASFADLDVDNSGTNQVALFAAGNTGGGTLNVTTGTAHGGTNSAVDVDNTVLGVTLVRTDSVGGAPVGIDLFQTTGSFAVVGDGSNARNGSGGTIQNKTGRGVRLNRVTNVTLNSLNITNTGDDGIFGGDELGMGDTNDFVDGLTMRGTVLSGNGDAANEHGMEFRDLLGTVLFDNVRVTAPGEHAIVHFNDGGTITSLTFQNSEIDNVSNGIGYNFELKSGPGGPNLSAGMIAGNNVHDNFSTGLFFVNNGTGSLGSMATPLIIQGNTLTNNNIAIDVSMGAQSSTNHFAIQNNPVILGNTSHAINVASADTAGDSSSNVINGTIAGNVIGNGTVGSGSTTGSGVRLNFSDPIDAAILVDNNQILNVKGRGIEAVGRLGGGGGNAAFTITNNMIRRDPGTPGTGDTFAGIYMSADGNGVCGNVRNNDVNGDICENFGAPGFVFLGCDILVQEVAGSVFQLESGATDCGGAACADAKAHLLANNSNTTANPLRVEEIDGGGTIVSGNIALVAPGTCDTP